MIVSDPAFNISAEEIQAILNPKEFIGRSEQQVDVFLREIVKPVLSENKNLIGTAKGNLTV